MAQSRSSADVHQDELCPPNKRYALMDANKKVDLENLLCLDKSRILADILKNHPLRFNIDASSSVSCIYLGQFGHTLHEDGSKYTLKFMLDRKELTLTLDDFETIFHLPQATDNNHDHFTTGLLQPWQTLCKMFSRCLTTRVTGYDQPAVQIMQRLYCFVNNIHVDYAELLWEGFYYPLKNQTTLIPYPIFTKLIMSHYMTAYPEISRRVRDRYHNLVDDVMIKSIFNSGKSKEGENTSAPMKTSVRLAEQKSHEELEATQNVEKVTSSPLWNDDNQVDPGTMLEPRNDKESPEVEKIVDISQPEMLIEEEKISEEDYKRYKSFFKELQGRYGYLFEHLSAKFMPRRKFNELAKNLEDIMMESLPKLVDERIKRILQTQVLLHVAQGIILEREKSQADVTKMIAEAIQQECVNLHLEISSQVNDAIANHIPSHVDSSVRHYMSGENSAKRQKIYEHGTFEIGGSSYGQDYEDDDMLPNEKVSQELMDEISQNVDEAKLRKVVDEMLRQQCTSGDEHQCYIDQMQNFLKSDIVWESRKEIIVPPYQPKPTPVVQSCQRDPKAPGLTLVNQDLLYLKKGNSGPDKIVLSLHKFPGVIFLDDDIE
ncbi:hypothetical protein Tco_1055294 [Tanacetum coccineum]|uniref:Uncharacterized protein n=1 Tax=Tanacetum coccineum TaxID=301880 RepID=A0ABQ5H131_9ASTR